MGNYKIAEKYYLKVKDIYEIVNKNKLDYCTVLCNLATLYQAMGDYTSAENYFLEVVKIERKILGEKHPSYATSLNNLGCLYLSMAKYPLAEKNILKAKDIREDTLGKKHPFYATSLHNLGNFYKDKGDYKSAEKCFQEAEEILKNNIGHGYAELLKSIGLLYWDMGDYDFAEKYFDQEIELLEKLIGKGNPVYASSLSDLGALNTSKGDLDLAAKYYIEAKNIFERKLGKKNHLYANLLSNLGSLYDKSGDSFMAIKYCIDAKNIKEMIFGKEHPDYALSLNNLGALYLKISKYTSAKNCFLEFKNIIERVLGREHRYYYTAVCNLDNLYSVMKDYKQALKYKQEACDLGKTLTLENFSFLSTPERNIYWNENKYYFETSYSLSSIKPTPEINCLNYDNALFTKGLLLRSIIAVRSSIYDLGDQNIISNFEEQSNLRQKIAALQQSSGKDTYIKDLKLEADKIDKVLIQKSSAFSKYKKDFTLSWQDVKKNLQDHEAAIEFVSFRLFNRKWTNIIQYAAMILRMGMKVPEWVTLCEESVIKIILSKLKNHNDQEQTNILYNKYGKQLYKAVWNPLEKKLKGVKTIYYAPSGLLHNISFNAIPITGRKHLMDKYNLNLVSSTREVVYRRSKNYEKPSTAVVYGGLKYDLPAAIKIEESKTNKSNGTHSNSDLHNNKRSYKKKPLGDLEFSKIESLRVKQELSNHFVSTNIYNGVRGNEESFRKLDKQKIGIIHLATHGFFEEDTEEYKDPLMKSGLVLSGAYNAWAENPIDGVENGIISSSKIAEMNLSGAELVVLSACKTGLGVIENTEGVFGLQRAFKLAGVETLIMSLWEIDDEFTSKFMVKFYKNWLSGKSKQESFKETQKHFCSDEQYSSPYYWAAFIMMD